MFRTAEKIYVVHSVDICFANTTLICEHKYSCTEQVSRWL